MSTKVEHKRVEELENYDITKAAEDDVLLIVGTNDGNKSGKIPVSVFRDQMAKFSAWNIVTMIISFITSLIVGKTGENYDGATAINTLVQYIKENWFDPATGIFNSDGMRALKNFCALGMLQLTDEAFAIVKTIWKFGSKRSDFWYLGRNTKNPYSYTMPGQPQPDVIYIVRYVDGGSKVYKTLEAAQQSSEAQHAGATIEAADWAGGADKQPYVFDWTKQRVSDLLSAMDMEEFMSGINPLSSLMNAFTKMGEGINQLSEAVQQMSPVVQGLASANLEARIAALEQALSQAQNSGSTGSPSNGGENQGDTEPDNGEDAALRSRAEALYSTVSGDDTSSMSLEQIISAMEQYLGITPDPGASYADRLDAIEAAGSQM